MVGNVAVPVRQCSYHLTGNADNSRRVSICPRSHHYPTEIPEPSSNHNTIHPGEAYDGADVEGWKHFRNLAKHEKHFLHLVKQAKMKSYHQSLNYKFGYRIPKDYEEALKLDELNQNTKWEDATITEYG